ncbi:hypothetical protein [Undibacterium baiyunense]|uniref:DUF2975 domain-containing protein n=1 Tax=Undibacterium baiyunense TaxID=2828731 RepID=A0A941DG28_9BURK|nr:hypothetical protein [Undibacterium baiyunense]MBR7746267.1 hypothetical protein [Undibacterium baiyunense]
MNLERNKRIAAFRKVSGYLLWVSMPLLILCGLGGTIGLFLFLFFPLGDIGLSALAIEIANNSDVVDWALQTKMTLFTRLVCFILGASVLSMVIYILLHFQKLIECFNAGEIFNRLAVSNARKAFKMNLYVNFLILGTQLLCVILVWSQIDKENLNRLGHLMANSFSFLFSLAFYSLILWALEIGTDLNEEAELTI